ncbi:MAG: glycosyltransferase, partial [Nitrososphaerales archaeon]
MPPKFTVFRIAEDYPADGRPSYGLQPVYYYLSREQAILGNEVHVIALRRGLQRSIEYYDSVTVHRIGKPFNLTALKKLRSLSRASERPIIHTHSTSGLLFGPMNQFLGIPLVSHVHGSTISRHMPIKLSLEGTQLDYSISK